MLTLRSGYLYNALDSRIPGIRSLVNFLSGWKRVTEMWAGCVSRLDKSVHICMLITKSDILYFRPNGNFGLTVFGLPAEYFGLPAEYFGLPAEYFGLILSTFSAYWFRSYGPDPVGTK